MTLLLQCAMLLKSLIFLGENMSIPMNPHEQVDFDQFKEDKEELIQQIMIEKGCSDSEARVIWHDEDENS